MAEPRLQRVLKVTSFDDDARLRPRIRYSLSRPPAERIAAVEFLRRRRMGVAPDYDAFSFPTELTLKRWPISG